MKTHFCEMKNPVSLKNLYLPLPPKLKMIFPVFLLESFCTVCVVLLSPGSWWKVHFPHLPAQQNRFL